MAIYPQSTGLYPSTSLFPEWEDQIADFGDWAVSLEADYDADLTATDYASSLEAPTYDSDAELAAYASTAEVTSYAATSEITAYAATMEAELVLVVD